MGRKHFGVPELDKIWEKLSERDRRRALGDAPALPCHLYYEVSVAPGRRVTRTPARAILGAVPAKVEDISTFWAKSLVVSGTDLEGICLVSLKCSGVEQLAAPALDGVAAVLFARRQPFQTITFTDAYRASEIAVTFANRSVLPKSFDVELSGEGR